MVLRRMTAAFALAVLATLAATTPASAHAQLISSNPAKGASINAAPQQLVLTFNETVSPVSITVAGPQGAQWTVGQIAVQGPTVTAPVTAVGPAGQYAITYRVTSDDGDPVTGTVAFTMTAAAAVETTPPPPTTTAPPTTTPASAPTSSAQSAPASGDDGGVPAWVWILIVIVVLAIGGVVGRGVLSRRGAGESEPSEK